MVDYTVLMITDGRGFFHETYKSAMANLPSPELVVIVDDSGDPDHGEWLHEVVSDDLMYWTNAVAIDPPLDGVKRGFGGAIQAGWNLVNDEDHEIETPYVFHLEDDFTFNEPVDIERMARILEKYGHVAQVALKRQPCSPVEEAHGGFMQVHRDSYTGYWGIETGAWVEHREFFTTNPSLYRRNLMEIGWPNQLQSEAAFSGRIFKDKRTTCAYVGTVDDPPRVTHIGDHRAGHGY